MIRYRVGKLGDGPIDEGACVGKHFVGGDIMLVRKGLGWLYCSAWYEFSQREVNKLEKQDEFQTTTCVRW